MITKIVYHVSLASLGLGDGATEAMAEWYRDWAQDMFDEEFPGVKVEIKDSQDLKLVVVEVDGDSAEQVEQQRDVEQFVTYIMAICPWLDCPELVECDGILDHLAAGRSRRNDYDDDDDDEFYY